MISLDIASVASVPAFWSPGKFERKQKIRQSRSVPSLPRSRFQHRRACVTMRLGCSSLNVMLCLQFACGQIPLGNSHVKQTGMPFEPFRGKKRAVLLPIGVPQQMHNGNSYGTFLWYTSGAQGSCIHVQLKKIRQDIMFCFRIGTSWG